MDKKKIFWYHEELTFFTTLYLLY